LTRPCRRRPGRVGREQGRRDSAKAAGRVFVLLAHSLESLEARAVRKDYFETDEGFDLLLKAVEAARRTRSRDKREYYARILRGAVLDSERREYSPEEYLQLVADLTPRELMVARSLYRDRPEKEFEAQPGGDAWTIWQGKVCGEVGLDVADLQLALGRLRSSGLLEEVTVGEDKTQGFDYLIALEPGEIPSYRVSPAFEKLMRFLEPDG
jgi:hypothetical protein